MNILNKYNLKKKRICFILAIIMTIGMVGCGKNAAPTKDSDGRIRLELATFGDDYNLAELILEFNRSQKKYYVETVEYNRLDTSESEDDLSLKLDDGIARLQREIVSGKGPDIIDYGEAFTTSDICGEYTENLRDYLVKEYGNINDYYYENVWDAFSYKGNLYCIPTTFYIETLVGKKKNLEGIVSWNLEQMIETISNKKGMSLWANASQMDVFTTLLTANMEQYIDWENGKSLFDSESFKKLLSYSKEMPSSPGEKVTQEEFGENKVLLYCVNTGSEYEVTCIKSLFGKEDLSFIGYPSENNEGNKVQTGATVLGISSSSKEKEGAFEFIKFALSEEIQKKIVDGFPINRRVSDAYIDEAQKEEYVVTPEGKKEPRVKETTEIYKDEIVNIYSISKEDAQETEKLLNSRFCSCNIDWNLYYVILDEAEEFFNDNQDLDKTIENIQSRASIYVAEKGM